MTLVYLLVSSQSRRVKVCDMGMQTTSDEPLFTTVTSKPDTDRSVPEPMLFRQPSKIPTPSFRSIPPRALLPQQDMGISERSLSLPPLAPAVPRRYEVIYV